MDEIEIRDRYFLAIAVAESRLAWQEGNAPIGAVLASADGTLLARQHNQTLTTPGLLYHAEMMIFLQNQDLFLNQRWALTLYTTLEPCVMCLSTAIVHHVKRVVWLVNDYWSGGTRCLKHHAPYLHHHSIELVHQPLPQLETQTIPLLTAFYAHKWPAERVARMLRGP